MGDLMLISREAKEAYIHAILDAMRTEERQPDGSYKVTVEIPPLPASEVARCCLLRNVAIPED